jgi:hypothetical protein
MISCFRGFSNDKKLSIYVHDNSKTLNTCLSSQLKNVLMSNNSTTWVNDIATNGCYYNTAMNIYIYPVANVAAIKEQNGD